MAPAAPPSVARPAPAAAPQPQAAPPKPAAHTTSAQPVKTTTHVAGSQEPTSAPNTDEGVIDYTRIPGELDRKFDEIDEDSALRPTIINPGDVWTRSSQKGLLSDPVEASIVADQQETEQNKAFDLLDALSRSGALPIHHASLHVVIAATHCFDTTLINTVIEENVNPIEKVERSVMIVATTIHAKPAIELLAAEQSERFLGSNPRLGSGKAQ